MKNPVTTELQGRSLSPALPLLSRWLPVILWAGVIFLVSADSDPYSRIPQKLYHWLWWTKLFGQPLVKYMGGSSHFTEYAILAFLVARAVIWKAKPTRLLLFTAFYLTTLYAFSDELHQILVPHRNFQLQDLGLDALGALLGLGVYWLWRRKSRLVATTRPPPIPSS